MGKSLEKPASDVDSTPDFVATSTNPMKTGKRVANEVVDNQVVGSKKQKIVNDDVEQAVEKKHFETETRENTKEDQISSSQEHYSPLSEENRNKENDNVAIQANKFPSGAVKNGSVDKEEVDVLPAIKSTTTQDAKKASSSNESKEEDKDDNSKEESDKHLEITEKSVDVPPAIKSTETTQDANIASNSNEPLEQDRDDNSKEDHQHLETSKKSDIDVEMLDASSFKKTPQTSVTSQSTGSKTVLMNNLSFSIKEEDVKNFFNNVGEIAEVHFDMKEDCFAGHGYVEFTSPEAAQKALKLNNELLLDNPVSLDLATERGVHPTTTPHATGSKTLYLGNLSFSIEEDDVRDFFKDAGEIAAIRFAIRDDRFLGYGHVEFTTAEAAQEALKLNNEVILDRRVKLDLARERGAYTTGSSMEKSNQKGGQAQGKTVYVRGFDSSVGFDNIRSALEKHFGKCGEISRMSIPKDYDSGTPRGVAFIDFADSNGFSQALGLDKSEVGGSVITVEEAKRQRLDGREGSGHGGGRGFGGGWSGGNGSGSGWGRESGSGSGWHRESGSGRSWHRETGSAGGWRRESGSGSGWHRESSSGSGWHRENGSGSGWSRESGWGRENGSRSSWGRENGSGSGWHRENDSGSGWGRENGSGSGWRREDGSGSSWGRESGSSRVVRFSGSHGSWP